MFSKKVKTEKIQKLRGLSKELGVLVQKCMVNPADTSAVKDFSEAKTDFTIKLIELTIGADSKQGKDGKMNFTFCQKLLTIEELNEVCNILDEYKEKYEIPYINMLREEAEKAASNVTKTGDDDLAIEKPVAVVQATERIFAPDAKINKNVFVDGIRDHIKQYQDVNRKDVMELAEYAVKLRKKQNLYATLIIGGIVLAIAGACVTGAVLYNKEHEDNEDDVDDIMDEVVDISDDDIVDITEEDVPDVVTV